MWIDRTLEKWLLKVVGSRPATLLTGPRQTGKSSLLAKLFPEAIQITLDVVSQARAAEENPRQFLTNLPDGQVVLDEIQYAPSLFRELKIMIDADRDRYGRWILTGSQRFNLMQEVSESLAGRIGILHLETLSAQELRDNKHIGPDALQEHLWRGGYPELWRHPELDTTIFFDSYLQTYLERDLRQVLNVSNLRDFQRLMIACATRASSLLNYADLARDTGISPKTAKSWLQVLEATGMITLLPPYYRSLGKRLTKAPKLYFSDHGLLCHLVNAGDPSRWKSHLLCGQLWENFVLCELLKTRRLKTGKELFYFQDQNGMEIDFVIDRQHTIELIEAKRSERTDPRRLNFSKIRTRFKDQNVHCGLFCNTPQRQPLVMKDYVELNPLYVEPMVSD